MSENVLEEPYASNYYNVYMKGALISMCIDILMREESNGNRSVLSLIKELSIKYGKDKPFDDDSFIDEYVSMTYPSIGEFLNTHVVGDVPINYNDFFTLNYYWNCFLQEQNFFNNKILILNHPI